MILSHGAIDKYTYIIIKLILFSMQVVASVFEISLYNKRVGKSHPLDQSH